MGNTQQKVLGIDPGSHRLGIACIVKQGPQIQLLFAETISAPASKDLYGRLAIIGKELNRLMDALSPTEVAIENIFHSHNTKSAFTLGIARGVAVAACLQRNLSIFEYAPTQVKSVVTGSGRADKAQVQKMVGLILGQKLKLGFDASDAIAVALCHASTQRLETLISC